MDLPVRQAMELRDDELIRHHQSGDASAFNTLVCRHDKKVLSIAARFTRCPEDARDIYQEVFYRVYKGLDRFRFRSEFSTWLYRITVNVCINYRRALNKDSLLSIDSGEAGEVKPAFDKTEHTAADILSRNEISRRIASALETLSPKQKMVLLLKHYEGHKIREIAGLMGCTDGTVKKYLFTAMDRMRDQLQDMV